MNALSQDPRSRAWRWLILLLLLAANPQSTAAAPRLELGAGLVLPDARFADFRWDTGPQTLVSGGLSLVRGANTLGLRLERHGGSQGTGLLEGPAALALHLSSLELQLGRRLVALGGLGLECWAQGHLGWLHLGYAPDTLRLDSAGGEPLELRFAAIDEWCGGGGLLLRRPLAAGLALGLDLDALVFALDSARRVGESLLLERERSTNWRLSLRLDWTPGFATPGPR